MSPVQIIKLRQTFSNFVTPPKCFKLHRPP
uniref:Uncharacterized protein n=1 Tax=Rhizophora mucronata TaxID=61149 RepID=A0A2P2QGW7_RHIMU